ncbi:MAG: Gfo/Idh/MocA family oxidoreductase [Pirellulaceae bacterium]|nr:Gfo/Idh/MocA family oxidoreductase [Pirellulaceae bacterium]
MKKPLHPSRRDVLKAAAGAAALGPFVWIRSTAKGESPNDRLNVAAIGTGVYRDIWGKKGEFDGRGATIGRHAAHRANMVACADANLAHARRFAQSYEGKCRVYQYYQDILQREDVDAVTIGTPDHWHTKIAVEAMRAGKDVYCEKPLTLTVDEGKLLCKVVRETGAVLQVGTQQRSECELRFLKAAALCRTGRLGEKIQAVSSVGRPIFAGDGRTGPFPATDPPKGLDWDFWLGQAPKVPYCKERCDYDFRWWFDYSGGQVTDWGVHHTDIAMWAMGLDKTGPDEIEGTGEFLGIPGGFDVAKSFDVTMRFAGGREIRLLSGDNQLILAGERGRIRVNRGGLTGKPIEELTEKDNQELAEEMDRLCRGKRPGDHMRNFFDCIKDRSLPISDVFSHHRSVSACHLANIQLRLGRKLRWDAVAEQFINDDEANAMLAREQRKPYTIEV